MRRSIQIITDMDTPIMAAAPPPVFDPDKLYDADWPTDLVERSGNVGIYYQRAMKNNYCLSLCRALSVTTELHHRRLVGYFKGGIRANCVVSTLSPGHDGTGGGYHLGSMGTNCFCDVKFDKAKNRYDPAFTSFIFVAEVTQPFAWYHAIGWADNSDQGEGLSRVMAIELMPGNLGPYGVIVKWLNNGRPDWTTQRVDQYAGRSIGCAMAYCMWARYCKKIPWEVIIGAGKGDITATIESMWFKISGSHGVYNQMMKDINKAYPPSITYEDNEANETIFR